MDNTQRFCGHKSISRIIHQNEALRIDAKFRHQLFTLILMKIDISFTGLRGLI